jgi:ATP-dependent Clp protease ATP-binding subunit ClpC
MTSNVGARLISKGKSMGFQAHEDNDRDYVKMKDTVMEEVKRVFNPEFINRLDEIIVFHQLTEADMEKILELMLHRVEAKMERAGFHIILSAEAKKHLIDVGFDPQYGARPLQRTIQRSIEDPLAEEILAKKLQGGSIYVDFDESAKKLTFSNKPLSKIKD